MALAVTNSDDVGVALCRLIRDEDVRAGIQATSTSHDRGLHPDELALASREHLNRSPWDKEPKSRNRTNRARVGGLTYIRQQAQRFKEGAVSRRPRSDGRAVLHIRTVRQRD
jgi:hypothetical protein